MKKTVKKLGASKKKDTRTDFEKACDDQRDIIRNSPDAEARRLAHSKLERMKELKEIL